MPIDAAHTRLSEAWAEIIQQKANADAALADHRWRDAETAVRKLRYACSELECAITEVQAFETE